MKVNNLRVLRPESRIPISEACKSSSFSQTPRPEIRNPKLLITGIEGFTGFWLYKTLKDKYDIYGTCLDNVGLKTSGKLGVRVSGYEVENNKNGNVESQIPDLYTCDITKFNEIEEVLKKVNPDYIIHLAALSFVNLKDSLPFYNVNVLGTENLLESICRNNINPKRIIFVSSANVYGRNAKGIVDENVIPEPVNHYAISKLAMEYSVKNYLDKLNITIVRPFNYTGPGQAEHFLIPKIVNHYKENKKEIELGNLDVIRDFSDVRFVCNCYDKLLKNGKKGEIYNICSSKEIHLKKIIDIMNEISGYTINVTVNPDFVRKNEIKKLIGDNSKIIKLFETNHLIDIRNTLKDMYKF